MKKYVLLILKGMGMGAADVVPGVSGGTIAFIVGIYEELLASIKSIDFQALRLLFTGKFSSFWKKINGNFLLAVLSGIAISFLSLAHAVTYLLENEPILIWAFFFGLVLCSTYFVGTRIKKWKIDRIIMFTIGAAIAYYVTVATPTQTPNELWFIFLSGMIAICAMILPGISGSFILLLLGKYIFVMDALKSMNLPIILTFIAGAAIGIILFSHFLTWLMHNYYELTIAALTGFMFGSLNKVWPWKEPLTLYTDSHGVQRALTETNIAPNEQLLPAIALFALGFILVFIIEKASTKKE